MMNGPSHGGGSTGSNGEDEAMDTSLGETSNVVDVATSTQTSVQPSMRRSRRRDDVCGAQLSAVQQEITDIKAALDKVPDSADARETLEMQKRIEFLQMKLETHHRWMDELKKLLVSAPLLDFALRHPDLEGQDVSNKGDEEYKDSSVSASSHTESQDLTQDLSTLDEWRGDALGKNFSSLLIAKHVGEAVDASQINASKLLAEFANPACAFGVQFDTRGWSIAANLDDKLLTFRASRIVPSTSAGSIALVVWKSIQYDDILRTFAPTVLDAMTLYESTSPCCCVTERIVQIEANGPVKTIVVTDSMEDTSQGGVESWQIAVESCDDPCLTAFVAHAKASESGSPPPVLPSFATRGVSNALDVVIAAKCSQDGPSGVLVQFAGSIQHEGTAMIPPKGHVQLVQYMINILPVYEELQLLAKP